MLGRLNAATVRLPPLRERRNDIEELARHFLKESREEVTEPFCTPEVLEILKEYRWPGNIRELGNVIRYAAAISAEEGGPLRPEHLGPLAPQNRKRAPILTTRSGSSEHLGSAVLDAGTRRWMTMTTLTVPPLRERDLASRRAMVLSTLRGRPITPEALQILESAPWFGNALELGHRLQVLSAAPEGLIGVAQVQHYLPELVAPISHAPIQVLLSPVRQASGKVGGLSWEIDAGALLLGRIRHLDELRRAYHDARVTHWLETIQEVCRHVEPACLDLSLLGRLSRAHLLVTRDADGLSVHLMPGTGLVAQAATLDEELQEVRSGRPFSIGSAGEVRILNSRGKLYLQLFFFAGMVAAEQYGEEALRRAEIARQPAGATLGTHADSVRTEGRSSRRLSSSRTQRQRVWELSEVEIEALTDIVASYEGGQFNRHLLSSLAMLRNRPACEGLVDYLGGAPRKAQYVVRLYEKPENEAARDHLRARFKALEDGARRVEILPMGLQRILET